MLHFSHLPVQSVLMLRLSGAATLDNLPVSFGSSL
jgi:hypothetical protein